MKHTLSKFQNTSGIKTFIQIRFKQALRIIQEIGWIRSLLIFPVIFFFFIGTFEQLIQSKLMIGVLLFSLLSMHINRKDGLFLKIAQVNPYPLYVCEYLLLFAPFWLGYIGFGKWLSLLYLLSGIFIIPLLSFSLTTIKWRSTIAFDWLPAALFEWKAGLRQYGYWAVLLYVFAVVFSSHIAVVPLTLLLLTWLTNAFYMEGEDRQLLEVFQLPAKAFLRMKCIHQLTIFWLLLLPLVVLFLFFHFSYWYILLYFSLFSLALQIFSIIFKYALYEPNSDLSSNSLFIALFSMGFIMPFFIPLPFIMAVRYYRKAINNLNYYLYAYH